jgi:hypothetical protein
MATDPNAYYGIGGARQNFAVVNPTVNPNTKYFADGGSVQDSSDMQRYRDSAMLTRAAMDNNPMRDPASIVIDRYMAEHDYPGTLSQYVGDEYGNAPITSAIQSHEAKVQHYAGGGSALYQRAKGPSSFKQGAFHLAAGGMPQGIGSMVRGAGDGQSDSIPAQLSDGEFVVSAPVVSALGRGSNTAGAKKLHNMQKNVMAKTYKGAKPPAARMGIGSMRAA